MELNLFDIRFLRLVILRGSSSPDTLLFCFRSTLIMKYSTVAIALVGAVAAMPQGKPIGKTITQTIAGLTDANGNLDGGNRPLVRDDIIDNTPCGRISFIFARASSEPTNMVRTFRCRTLICDLRSMTDFYRAVQLDHWFAPGSSEHMVTIQSSAKV